MQIIVCAERITMDHDYTYYGIQPDIKPTELSEKEKQRRQRQLDAVIASASAYIDSAMYQLEGIEPAADLNLSDAMDSLYDARQSLDEIRQNLSE